MKLVGLLAKNPETSIAPAVMEAFFKKKGLSYHYQAFAVDPPQFREAFEGLKVLSGIGFNVGAPYRSIAMRYISRISEEASFVGALDTVTMAQGRDTGHNVQTGAVEDFLEEIGFRPRGARAMVIGAGATASSVIFVLLKKGAETVWVANKTLERAEALSSRYDPYYPGRIIPILLSENETRQVLPECGLVIHATPLGSKLVPMVYPKIHYASIGPGAVAVDMVYEPLHTPFLARCSRITSKTHSGLRIFALGLARSWKLWTRRQDTRAIWEAVNEIVKAPKP